MKTDPLVMKKIIEGEWESPCCKGEEVKKIKEINRNLNLLFQHVLRAGNVVEYVSANLVICFAGTISFRTLSEYAA